MEAIQCIRRIVSDHPELNIEMEDGEEWSYELEEVSGPPGSIEEHSSSLEVTNG